MKTKKNLKMSVINSSIKCFYIFAFSLFSICSLSAQITVSSIAALAAAAANSDQTITMTPGVYNMIDYLTATVKANNTPADAFGNRAMIRFSGSNNTFDFTGVTINVDTALLNDLGGNVIEFHLTGNYINFKGLTVTDIGNSPTASGGQSLTVSGDNIVVENVRLNMSGSSPYGYGDLLGKGGPNLVSMKKHSGLLVGGLNVTIKGCSIYSQSFGHLFFVQGGRNVLFENCYAEAVTRTTDSMLAETSGTAFNLNFEAVYPNYDGVSVITPGYTKSLSECAFRSYGEGGGNTTAGITLINCTAKNARVGFAFEIGGPVVIKDCEAIGCEAGYNVSDVTIENSRGDAVNGPLLYLSGTGSVVDLALMNTLPTTILHAIATVSGTNQKVSFKNYDDANPRTQLHKIMLGATRPTGSNPFSPIGSETTTGVTINNCTNMPVEVLSTATSSIVNSVGAVTNNGTGNTINTNSCVGIVNLNFDDGTYTYTVMGTSPNECRLTGFVTGKETANGLIPGVADNDSVPFNVVAIGDSAFNAKTILTSVTLPSTVKSIGTSAFQSCTNLTAINLDKIVTYGDSSFSGCTALTIAKLDFTNTVSTGSYCFLNCSKITSVVVPGTLKLGIGALRGTGITSFTIPNQWTIIPEQMVRDCKSIKTITIPSSITTMGVASFRGCTGLTDMQVNWTTSATIPSASVSNLFNGLTLNNINLLVPTGTVALYKAAAVWTDFKIAEGVLLSTIDNKFTSNELRLFPNPSTNGSFELNVKNNTEVNVKIYSVLGELVLEKNLMINSKTVNIDHNLKAGVYIVKLNNAVSTKLIVK